MKTDWLTETEQAEADKIHDACVARVETIAVDARIAGARESSKRDRAEAKLVQSVADRLHVAVAELRPLRDSQNVMIGVTRGDPPSH